MIDPQSATYLLIGFLFIWAILIPVFGAIPKIRSIISFRYLIVVVFLACLVGVIIDFGELDSSVRMAVIIGTMIICGIYIIIRSVEKAFYNGWIENPTLKANIKKGDLSADIELKDTAKDIDKDK
jgi:hypothetical protein